MNKTHSLISFVQFPIKSGIFPSILLPSILLQQCDKAKKAYPCTNKSVILKISTYKLSKFLRRPNDLGIVPLKLFADSWLHREMTNIQKLCHLNVQDK